MKGSLEQFRQMCKRDQNMGFISYPKEELLIVLIIVLVGAASFGLGRLSTLGQKQSAVRLVNPEGRSEGVASTNANSSLASARDALPASNNGTVVASKNGRVYHLPWCPGALKIKPENLRQFASKEEAEAAGLTPAANCKGL